MSAKDAAKKVLKEHDPDGQGLYIQEIHNLVEEKNLLPDSKDPKMAVYQALHNRGAKESTFGTRKCLKKDKFYLLDLT